MNLLGRYLEEGEFCLADPLAARRWYRRSAEGGDFRGQFSHGSVLIDNGQIDEGLVWLRKAMNAGNPAFLEVSARFLSSAPHARLRALAQDYIDKRHSLVS
jgi:TPR repeat protein